MKLTEEELLRVRNLSELIGNKRGARAAFCRKNHVDQTQIGAILRLERPFTEKAARGYETAWGLAKGYFDMKNPKASGQDVLHEMAATLDRVPWLDPKSKAHILGFIEALKKE